MIIYKLTFPSGKAYVGITKNSLRTRVAGHVTSARGGSQYYVHKAIRKYAEKFEAEILERCATYEELLEKEKTYIGACGTLAPAGYNLTLGGEGVCPSEPSRAKMRRAAARVWASPEHRAKHAAAQKSEKLLRTRSEASKRYMRDPEVRAKYSELCVEMHRTGVLSAAHLLEYTKSIENRESAKARLEARWEDPAEKYELLTKKSRYRDLSFEKVASHRAVRKGSLSELLWDAMDEKFSFKAAWMWFEQYRASNKVSSQKLALFLDTALRKGLLRTVTPDTYRVAYPQPLLTAFGRILSPSRP